jgi:hypothetical protein
MFWKDRITPAADGHPQARKRLGTVGEHQAESDVLDEVQRRPFIVDAQAGQPTETAVTLSLQRLKTIAHDVVTPSPLGVTLEHTTSQSVSSPAPDALSSDLAVPCDHPLSPCRHRTLARFFVQPHEPGGDLSIVLVGAPARAIVQNPLARRRQGIA